MKKLLVTLLITTVASISFARDVPGFLKSNPTAEKIDEYIAIQKADKDVHRLVIGMTYKALVGKDAKNTTYEEMKNIVFNAVKPYSEKLSSQIYLRSFAIHVLTLNHDNFKAHRKSFANDIFEDNANIKTNIKFYIYLLKNSTNLVGEEATIKALRNIINNPILTSLTFKNVQDIVSVYQKLRIGIAPAEQLKDLQRIKMVFYPKITTSEEWKKLLVKVELMIKSVQ